MEQKHASGQSYEQIGEWLGVTKTHAWNIHNKLASVGQDVENRLAKLVSGGSIDSLRTIVSTWHTANRDWVPAPLQKERQVRQTITYGELPGANEALTVCLRHEGNARDIPDVWLHGALDLPAAAQTKAVTPDLLIALANVWHLSVPEVEQADLERKLRRNAKSRPIESSKKVRLGRRAR